MLGINIFNIVFVTVNGKDSAEIDDGVVRKILNLYPEEKLENRPVFQGAFSKGKISIRDLKLESDKILVPWQMFFLTESNFNKQMARINSERQHKVSAKLVAKRSGGGISEVTSKRIIDRLIRQQNFVTSQGIFPINTFCGSLKNINNSDAVKKILKHFSIDLSKFWNYANKRSALEYLIERFELGNINVSRGVLTNKLLPTHGVVSNDIYKSTSGFTIKDKCIPFIFLPNEINPDEVESRQIYTLVYLLVIIGLEEYDYFLDKDFNTKVINATGTSRILHDITTEFLIPNEETEKLRGKKITESLVGVASGKFKLSPSALVTTLLIRGVISRSMYESLKPSPYVPKKQKVLMKPPKISTSVEKFCGQISYKAINSAIQIGSLQSVQAQYLIFGAINKKGYRKYRNELGI